MKYLMVLLLLPSFAFAGDTIRFSWDATTKDTSGNEITVTAYVMYLTTPTGSQRIMLDEPPVTEYILPVEEEGAYAFRVSAVAEFEGVGEVEGIPTDTVALYVEPIVKLMPSRITIEGVEVRCDETQGCTFRIRQ